MKSMLTLLIGLSIAVLILLFLKNNDEAHPFMNVPVSGINHTGKTVRMLWVNDRPIFVGEDYNGSAILPKQWDADFKLDLKWIEVDDDKAIIPHWNDPNYSELLKLEVKKNSMEKIATIPIAKYTQKEDVCGLKVHLFSCHQPMATISCFRSGMEEYPIDVGKYAEDKSCQ